MLKGKNLRKLGKIFKHMKCIQRQSPHILKTGGQLLHYVVWRDCSRTNWKRKMRHRWVPLMMPKKLYFEHFHRELLYKIWNTDIYRTACCMFGRKGFLCERAKKQQEVSSTVGYKGMTWLQLFAPAEDNIDYFFPVVLFQESIIGSPAIFGFRRVVVLVCSRILRFESSGTLEANKILKVEVFRSQSLKECSSSPKCYWIQILLLSGLP